MVIFHENVHRKSLAAEVDMAVAAVHVIIAERMVIFQENVRKAEAAVEDVDEKVVDMVVVAAEEVAVETDIEREYVYTKGFTGLLFFGLLTERGYKFVNDSVSNSV